ncbi:MAG TPA: hypothetical protein VKS21_01530 [Spirochaetota bacterium]|nr:hypothetical protein [Spirochaetota bacterium]
MSGKMNRDVFYKDKQGKVSFAPPRCAWGFNIRLNTSVRIIVKKALLLQNSVLVSDIIRWIDYRRTYEMYFLN